MGKRLTIPVLLLTACGLGCTGESPSAPAPDDHQHSAGAQGTDGVVRLSEATSQRVGVDVAEIGLRRCNHVLKRTGQVLAPWPQTAIISYAFPARIAEVHVEIGETVKQGQPVVTLECHTVGEAISEFYKARADLDLAQINLAREQRLLDTGIGVKKNFAAAEAAHKIAQSAAEAAEKKLHVLGFTEKQVGELADTHQINPTITLDSPIAGKVVAHNAVRGALVEEMKEILKIVDLSMLWVDADIFEKDIAKVKLGQEVGITVPAYPGEVFRDKVSYIGDVVDETTHTVTVRAEVDNQDGRLKPGLLADVEISLNGNEEVLVVPTTAVLEEGDVRVVFVQQQEKGSYERREVELGFCDGEYQEVVSGLKAGEIVRCSRG